MSRSEYSQNWARNLTYAASAIHAPTSLGEAQRLVAASPKIRALGSQHSFNAIADTSFELISLRNLPREIEIDRDRLSVSVSAGTKYGEFCADLHAAGFALPNLASLPHISVAGTCATATHGSGELLGNLATSVVGMDLIGPDGTIKHYDLADDPSLAATLGCLGIITRLTLQVEPTFDISQQVFFSLPLDTAVAEFDAIQASGYSVSLFTSWTSRLIEQVWIKSRNAVHRTSLFGASAATANVHPLPGADPINCTDQLGVVGPWHERLPHFKMGFTPSSGEELQTEYYVPRRLARAAIEAIWSVQAQIAPLLQISEIRSIAADRIWMSPCFGESAIAFHFTWRKDVAGVGNLLPMLDNLFGEFEGKPHWGKLFHMNSDRLSSVFPRIAEFARAVHSVDPSRKFSNAFMDQLLRPYCS